jgi:hypothetical protein
VVGLSGGWGLKLFGFFGVELGEAAGDASVRRERREAKVKKTGVDGSQDNISIFVLHFGGNHTITAFAAGLSRNTVSWKTVSRNAVWRWLIAGQ